MYEWPLATAWLIRRQPELATQVRPRIVVVLLVVLSRSVTVAQSNRTVSGQVTLYQTVSVPPAAVKVCAMLEVPLVAEVEPARAAKLPECWPAATIEVAAPLVIQPEKVPVSNPPLTIPLVVLTVQLKDADPVALVVSVAVTDQLVLTAVSSTTNEVCSEMSSVPENFRVTVVPAKLPSE